MMIIHQILTVKFLLLTVSVQYSLTIIITATLLAIVMLYM